MAFEPLEIVEHEARPRAFAPGSHRKQRIVGANPDIQVPGHRHGLLRRVRARLTHDCAHRIRLHRDAPAGVRLDERGLVPRIVLGIDRVDQREEPVVLDRAAEHPRAVIPHLPADASVVRRRRRDREQERMQPLAHRGEQHVVDLRRLVAADLVAHREMHVQPVERLGVRADRHEFRGGAVLRDRVGERLDAVLTLKHGRTPHHLLRGVERNARLIACHRRGVALGAALALNEGQVQRDRR